MSNLLQLQAGFKGFGAKKIFEQAQFALNEGEHVGVIGPNGAGKTTLFRILTGEDHLDSGQLVKAKSLRLGYLAQHDHWPENQTIEEYLINTSRFPIWELKTLGNKLGLNEEIYQKKILSLSGGYRMRCKLLSLLGQDPNLMLLDEPTNYLDLETTLVLENFLQSYKGAFLLISHDREFLRRTTDHILEVEQGEITKYNGNLDDYFEQKELLRTQLEARAMSLAEKRKNILDFVSRFGAKASKAKQAQSRMKSLQRMEKVEIKALPLSARIKIPSPTRTGKQILSMSGVDLGYTERTVLKNIDLQFHNGDHIAVVGLNGAGKSTFLKALAQKLSPQRGKIELGFGVTIGYYAQHVAESIQSHSTVIDEMTRYSHPEVTRQEALNMAGSLLFGGDDIKKKISVLSGGEKSRVALGQILLQKNPCLILDEPTNHLDFQTVEALTQALMSYQGTVIVVSHDRSFIGRVGTKILEVNRGQVQLYPGSYDEYVWSLEKGVLADRFIEDTNFADSTEVLADTADNKINSQRINKTLSRDDKKNLEKQLRGTVKKILTLDSQLSTQQEKLKSLNEKIQSGAGEDLKKLSVELGQVQALISSLEEEWLSASDERDQLRIDLGLDSRHDGVN
ncbi:MAG: ABC-F family ATP-binding cassette domain-containing protein [Bdellovibrionota bacterium]